MPGLPRGTRRCFLRQATFSALAAFTPALADQSAASTEPVRLSAPAGKPDVGLEFIDQGFENASPLSYAVEDDGTVAIQLNFDHERSSPNRAIGHIHFQLQARPGSEFVLKSRNFENTYNGRPASVARERRAVVVSTDGTQWQPLATEATANGRVRLPVRMPGPRLFVARVQPYGISALERLLSLVQKTRQARIQAIGKTVEGRPLEIVCLGNPRARHSAFVRARAHPWEPGGYWVVDGFIRRLLQADADVKQFLRRCCVYIMPMASKDGVFHGRTSFNLNGKDFWFSEGTVITRPAAGTLPGGWHNRFGICGALLELNCHWIASLSQRPLGQHGEQFGAGLCRVFDDYFTQ